MLIFHCTVCNEAINAADHESPDWILDRLGKHVRKCLFATFTSEGTTDAARQRLENLKSVIESSGLAGKIQSQ
jgi:hypothetical protein